MVIYIKIGMLCLKLRRQHLQARRMIGRSVEICVTSVLQTASGKMIFGKVDEALKPEPVRGVEVAT